MAWWKSKRYNLLLATPTKYIVLLYVGVSMHKGQQYLPGYQATHSLTNDRDARKSQKPGGKGMPTKKHALMKKATLHPSGISSCKLLMMENVPLAHVHSPMAADPHSEIHVRHTIPLQPNPKMGTVFFLPGRVCTGEGSSSQATEKLIPSD